MIAEAVIAAIDNREPRVPDDLLALPPGATAAVVDLGTGNGSGDGGGVSTVVLTAAIAIAFVAGAAVSGAYFLARGRA